MAQPVPPPYPFDVTPDDYDRILMVVGGRVAAYHRDHFNDTFISGTVGTRPDRYDRVLMEIGDAIEAVGRDDFIAKFLGAQVGTRPDRNDSVMMVIGNAAVPVTLQDFTDGGWAANNVRFIGTAPVSFSGTANFTLITPARLAGTAAVSISETGNLYIRAPLAGTAAVSISETGNLTLTTPAAALAGTAAVSISETGNLNINMPLAGTVAVSISETGNLTLFTGDGALAGTLDVSISETGNLSINMPLAGTAAVSITESGNLNINTPLAGTVSVTPSATGNLTATSANPLYRPHWSAEALSEVTAPAGSTNYGDVVLLTHAAADQEASADYALFWGADGNNSSTTSDYRLRLTVGGSAAVTANSEPQEVVSPIDYDSQGGLYFYNAGSTPADIAFAVQIGKETAGDTAKARNGRLSIMKIGANDKFDTSVTRVTTTSNTFQDTSCSITFTPPSSGDYILIATALIDAPASGGGIKMRISDGTNVSLETGMRSIKDATTRQSAMVIWRQNSVSGSRTYRIQYNSSESDGATAGISEMRLLILRVSDFANVYYAVQGADDSGTQTSYQTTVSQTFTPAPNDHFTLTGWRWGGSSNTISSYLQYLDGSDVVSENVKEPTLANGRYAGLTGRIVTYAASSRTQALQRKSETSSTTTNANDVNAIVTLDLSTP